MFGAKRHRREREREAQFAAVLDRLGNPVPKRRRAREAARTGRAVVFRLRRQLAPLAVIGALWLAAAVVAAANVPAGAVTLLSLLAATALWRLRYSPRLDRPVERRYAAVCLAAGVLWLTLAAI